MSSSQEINSVLFKIDNKPVYTSEFIRMYNKQIEMLGIDNVDSKEDYFELFKDYKLKVKAARDLRLDTTISYKKELATYRERLIQPYLKDEKASELLIDEAYERSINKVNASHILIKLSPKFTPADSIKAFNEISELRKRIILGEDFEAVAKEYSQDPSAKVNGGNLGDFSAFQMVYPFESAAYNTKVGEVSTPFRTSFGYHIVKTNAFHKVEGQREVAHIMIADKSDTGKARIDSIYNVLNTNPEKFQDLAKDLSDDSASATNGGKLPKMSKGDAIESFEKVVFNELNNSEEISEPFQTEFGWHIAKLFKIYPVPTKEELYPSLKKKVLADSRSSLEITSLVNKLENNYNVKENTLAVSEIVSGNWSITDSDKSTVILSINDEAYTLEDFILFLKRDKTNAGIDAFKKFKEVSILDYYKSHLEETDETFKWTLNEFSDGLLLFSLMELEVWNPSKNVVNQQQYFESNRGNYEKTFRESQGKVIADYQNYLEKEWLNQLKQNHTIEINSAELSRILNE